MRINTNLNAMTALNQMSRNTALAGTAMNKISSGERINKAGDDAAGMAISEKMRGQIRGLDQASKNTQDGISVVQTAEGAMEETGNILQRMRELSVQSANETNSAEDRSKIAEELNQLTSEIDRIANSTEFNGKKILNGGGVKVKDADITGSTNVSKVEINNSSLKADDKLKIEAAAGKVTATITKADGTVVTQILTGVKDSKDDQELNFKDLGIKISVKGDAGNTGAAMDGAKLGLAETTLEKGNMNSITIQAGANSGNDANQTITVNLNQTDSATLGIKSTDIDGIKDVDLSKGTKASNDLITKLDTALETINTSRANLGAVQNRLETAQSNLTTSSENLTAAESRIRDVDVAKEMINLSKLNLLTQASQAMAGQAKQQPEGVMQLLR
ncbi:flagellar hook-associated protein 3 [[Clostridium] bifermentans ATCC 19299]|uniref:flagellar hook-associated protein FlgL n=1 Tax=Paraclostridium bifermentans TaxID=1490 RepID=UPI00038D9BAB|nr:flagellar hook-associated protein FlgL [Paraclostridium bifermentans]EQK45832.1 flagellar hook-associated protein 3 [[Clostridium] bifermentans ATCC 19299] [Paraclostridium bifermentans ATCC 19299]MCR1875438.1 flagellar hook-associated protein FlgL [Paraclostridium bifermentans]